MQRIARHHEIGGNQEEYRTVSESALSEKLLVAAETSVLGDYECEKCGAMFVKFDVAVEHERACQGTCIAVMNAEHAQEMEEAEGASCAAKKRQEGEEHEEEEWKQQVKEEGEELTIEPTEEECTAAVTGPESEVAAAATAETLSEASDAEEAAAEKVVEEDETSYECEKCNRAFDTYNEAAKHEAVCAVAVSPDAHTVPEVFSLNRLKEVCDLTQPMLSGETSLYFESKANAGDLPRATICNGGGDVVQEDTLHPCYLCR
jgi:DNA-directed RNA polymerase subunit RPC12/RpoP